MKIDTHQESNQFNFLRFFAAFLVFFGHGYVLIGSHPNTVLTHSLGVYIFFAISGYLISMSWDKDPSLIRFFIRRSTRIFPALIVCILLSVFILGPILTTLTIKEYFSNYATLFYLNNIFLFVSYYLPGVFEHNSVPNAINGSLWSLPVEFLMYIIVAVIGLKKEYMKYISLCIFLILLFSTQFWALSTKDVIIFYGMDLKTIVYTGVYFWAGAFLYHFNIKKYFSFESFVLTFLVLIFIFQWEIIYSWLILILIPFIVLSFGFSNSKYLNVFNKFDYSYGFYIYAFPVQQTLAFLYPSVNIYFHLIVGFIITIIFASLSWHFIEKPCLKFKPKNFK
ncbi:acyltransferase [Arcobacter cryaerophilus gv. occultus]|uniref:acyltransferase family protein n=1 Tax=Aliarcobacter cryaerophilus TaxID=28198 RepID=UPI000D01BFF6|nr:acyltransferase [Aliarcobacter cryaerophilus]PRM91351.1 acyltransferase [Arcobacter cryaerophilus gv. occultus]